MLFFLKDQLVRGSFLRDRVFFSLSVLGHYPAIGGYTDVDVLRVWDFSSPWSAPFLEILPSLQLCAYSSTADEFTVCRTM